MAKVDLTAQRLREILFYDPETGLLTWIASPARRVTAGDEAGCLTEQGYRKVSLSGGRFYTHRLAWLYTTGEWPTGEIDHINGKRSDNRIENLRDVSRSRNNQNRRHAAKNSLSGLLGVEWHSKSGLWQARIKTDTGRVALGYYKTAEEAHQVYLIAKRRLHEGCTI